MSDLKQKVKRLIFGLLGKDPETIVLSFLTGGAAGAAAMVEQVRALIPDRRHFAVGLGFQPDISGVTGVSLRPGSTWETYRELRRHFGHFRIGMAPVLFTADPRYRALRRAAFLLSPGKVLAYNARGERHHPRLRSAVASMLFLRGAPLSRVDLDRFAPEPDGHNVPVLTIRAAAEEDLARIAEIQAASPPAAQWAAPSYLAYDCRVATVAGRVAGFLVLRSVEGEHEILNLAVAPELRRRGVATALIQNAIQTCGGPVFLEVRESNSAARNLYQRLGFNPAAVRRSYYSDPEESAIVMRF